jgi:hypothetical protein
MQRLDRFDRASGLEIRRYERERPGELVHTDTKKLARIPTGGGHRLRGREAAPHTSGEGYEDIHSAVDDHSRLAYSEIRPDERGESCAALLARAAAFYAEHGICIERLLTDNAKAYRNSREFRRMAAQLGIAQRFIRPRHPQTNGKHRALQPDLPDRVGLRPALPEQRRARPLAPRLGTPLQLPSVPHRARRASPHLPCQQRLWERHQATILGFLTRTGTATGCTFERGPARAWPRSEMRGPDRARDQQGDRLLGPDCERVMRDRNMRDGTLVGPSGPSRLSMVDREEISRG